MMRFTPALLGTPDQTFLELGQHLRYRGHELHAPKWQGITAPAPMLEVIGVSFRLPIQPDTKNWAHAVQPNLPWADEHFAERVSGIPSNPGEAYRNWPFYPKSTQRDREFRPQEQFTHTYQERFWPKWAGGTDSPHRGIRFEYGDLNDVVTQLFEDPFTRQAYLPVFFPEDTGARHGGRVPCSIGYQFIQRNGYLHCIYTIRSCDYFRHMRDDVYLAGRLAMWVLDQLRTRMTFMDYLEESDRTRWDKIHLGFLDMHIGSLHCWLNERRTLPE